MHYGAANGGRPRPRAQGPAGTRGAFECRRESCPSRGGVRPGAKASSRKIVYEETEECNPCLLLATKACFVSNSCVFMKRVGGREEWGWLRGDQRDFLLETLQRDPQFLSLQVFPPQFFFYILCFCTNYVKCGCFFFFLFWKKK